MRLTCTSDTHGARNWHLDPMADAVIHGGDLFPSFSAPWIRWHIAAVEAGKQLDWLVSALPELKQQIGDRPFLFVSGNHDYASPLLAMRAAGIDAYDLHDEPQVINGHTFSGFKYVPEFCGWANMLREEGMAAALRLYEVDLLRHPADVIVCHGPVRGILDKNMDMECCGNQQMYDLLKRLPKRPTHFICGHIHDSHGHARHMGIDFINTATVETTVELR